MLNPLQLRPDRRSPLHLRTPLRQLGLASFEHAAHRSEFDISVGGEFGALLGARLRGVAGAMSSGANHIGTARGWRRGGAGVWRAGVRERV